MKRKGVVSSAGHLAGKIFLKYGQDFTTRVYCFIQHYCPPLALLFVNMWDDVASDKMFSSLILSPQSLKDYCHNVDVLLNLKKYSYAENMAIEALRAFGHGVSPEHIILYELQISIAERREEWRAAIGRVKRLLKIQPSYKHPDIGLRIARCYARYNRNFTKAEEVLVGYMNDLRRSADQDPALSRQYMRLYYFYTDLAVRKEDWPAAIERLNELLKMQSDKDKVKTFLRLSDCYFAQKNIVQSVEYFERALELSKKESASSLFHYDSCFTMTAASGHRHNIGFYEGMRYLNDYVRGCGATLIVVRNPLLREMCHLSRWEKKLKNGHRFSHFDFYKLHRTIPNISKDYLKSLSVSNIVTLNGIGVHMDYRSHYVNFAQGRRTVTGQPQSYRRTVWCVGSSRYCSFCEDQYTIASCLQAVFNDFQQDVRVVDCSVRGNTVGNQIETIKRIPINRGDIILIEDRLISRQWNDLAYEHSFYALHGIAHHNLNDDFKEKRYVGEMFVDNKSHVNYRGNQEIARILHERFFSVLPLIDSPIAAEINRLHQAAHGSDDEGHARDQDLSARIRAAYAAVPVFTAGKVGAIVMNCNPITLGHLHLIRLAAQIVDHLYVFVVEEDRSVFPFADRLAMIGQAVASLANVVVVPSGRFILSAETFPEYFEKDMKQDTTIDTSHDIGLFGGTVARHFNITVRFVGEEPTDTVTRQYNEEMKAALPRHGVQVIEIPRLTCDDDAISASRVRALLRDGRWDDLARLCPPTTVAYLRQMAQDGRLPLLG